MQREDIIDKETPGRGLGVPNHSSGQLLKELIGMKGHLLNHLQWTLLTLKCLPNHYEASKFPSTSPLLRLWIRGISKGAKWGTGCSWHTHMQEL